MKKLILVGISLIFVQLIFGQTWTGGQVLGGEGNDQAFFLRKFRTDQWVVSGIFEQRLQQFAAWPDSRGSRDIFLAKYADGEIGEVRSIGGPFADRLWALDANGKGDLVVAGQYTVEVGIDDQLFQSDPFSSATFLARFDRSLVLQWWIQLVGTGIIEVSDIKLGSFGEMYVAGSFQDSMWWDTDLWVSGGESDMFVARVDTAGNLDWLRHFGQSGDTRATAMDEKNGRLLLAGVFNDQTSFGGAGMTANTKDLDVFLLSMDGQAGEVGWAVKAGGVFDEEVSKVVLDDEGFGYAFGQLIGVMNISPQQSIQSSTGQSDLFLLKYDTEGIAVLAKAFNAPGPQLAADLEIKEDKLIISGYFQQALSLSPLPTEASDNYAGFVAAIDKDNFGPEWLLQARGREDGVYPSDLLVEDNEILVLGNFSDRMSLDQSQLDGIGQFDIFLASIESGTSTY